MINPLVHYELEMTIRQHQQLQGRVALWQLAHQAATDGHCLEIDVFCPPRQSLLELAEAHAAGTQTGVAKGPGEPAAGDPDQRPADGQTGRA